MPSARRRAGPPPPARPGRRTCARASPRLRIELLRRPSTLPPGRGRGNGQTGRAGAGCLAAGGQRADRARRSRVPGRGRATGRPGAQSRVPGRRKVRVHCPQLLVGAGQPRVGGPVPIGEGSRMEETTEQLSSLQPGGSETLLPTNGPALRTGNGRLAAWVFDLPVAELRAGYRAGVYFDRTRRILAAEGADTQVTMQVFQRGDGVVACGIDEALAVLALGAGAAVDQAMVDDAFAEHLRARNRARRARLHGGQAYLDAVRAQVETEVTLDRLWRPARADMEVRALRDGDLVSTWEPVIEITGPYRLFAHLESVYLGVLARRSLVATNVRRVVAAANGKPVVFFADRFDHWATQGGDGYAAFVGGAQGVATDAQAAWWGERGLGTTPHALIATFAGDTVAAMRAFARHIPDVPLVALVDFHNDCVGTSLACAREFRERLWGVRLDTAANLVDRSLWEQLGDFDPTGVNP